MKRDLSLVRKILLKCEGALPDRSLTVDDLANLHDDRAVIIQHIAIMDDAHLIDLVNTGSMRERDRLIKRLTWQGHEFLDATRDESVWKIITARLLKEGASWTFEIVKEWAQSELRHRLALPGGGS